MQRIKLDKNFKPFQASDADELFPNGIFVFNITKISEFICENKDQITFENIEIKFYRKDYSACLDEKQF